MTLDSVTFSDTNTVTIGADGNTLTLMGTGAASAITANQNATISAPLALGSSQTWTTASGAKLTVGGIVSGNYALTTAGSGTVVLTAANTYGGSTNISGGTLSIGNGTTNGTISSGSYNIGSNGTLLFSANSGGMTTPVWTNIFGSGTLALQTAKNFDTGSWGTIALPAAFTGTLQINSGRVPPASTAGLGGTTAIVVQAGGQLALYNLAAGSVLTQPFTIAGTGYGETNYESAIRFQPASSSSTTLTGNITLSANATVGNSGGRIGRHLRHHFRWHGRQLHHRHVGRNRHRAANQRQHLWRQHDRFLRHVEAFQQRGPAKQHPDHGRHSPSIRT